MKKIKLLIVCTVSLLFLSVYGYAQIWNGDLIFSSQQQIDDFSNFPYSTINGDVRVIDSLDGVHDIRNLAGLGGITQINGWLIIESNHLLPDLRYLNLVGIQLHITIRNNPVLTTINGMMGLTSFSGSVLIENNATLTSVVAFSLITTMSNLTIKSNPPLTDLAGLANLTTLTGHLDMYDNAALSTLNFSSLITVNSNFRIWLQPLITNLEGLPMLKTVGGVLEVFSNSNLSSLDGLSSLKTLRNGLIISGNPMLQNINALNNLDTLAGLVWLRGNNALTSINGFNNMDSISELLIDTCSALTAIAGFSNVKKASKIEIKSCPALTSINGFEVLDSIHQELLLTSNRNLTTINGFQNLEFANQIRFVDQHALTSVSAMQLQEVNFIELSRCYALPDLDFFNGISKTGDTYISDCLQLSNLNGFSNIAGNVNSVNIQRNNQLINISGLGGITSLSNVFRLESCIALPNLSGLQNIKKAQSFVVFNLPKVTNIDALSGLDSVGVMGVASLPQISNINGLSNLRIVRNVVGIQDNASLSNFCGLYNLYTGSGAPPTTQIFGNLQNPTPQQIIDGGACAVLPVKLIFFNFRCNANSVSLRWKTAQEQNSSHFNIERSVNGNSWAVIGNLTAAGNSVTEKEYSLIDAAPVTNGFYRLAQYDFDGGVHYSDVLTASCAVKELITLWPNPVGDQVFVNITTNHPAKVIIRLVNSNGALVKKQESVLGSGTTKVMIDTKNIASGMYLLLVVWDDGRNKKTFQLIK